MFLGGVLVFCALSIPLVNAEWMKEISSARGLDLGSGFSIHLDPLKRENASFLENHALRFDYSGMGLSVGKALNKEAFQVQLYTSDDEVQGRQKNAGMLIIPAIMSFKATGAFALAFIGSAILVFKAIGVAKVAILLAAGLWLSKYFVYKPHVDVEQYPAFHAQPVYLADFPSAGTENVMSYSHMGNNEYQGSDPVGQYAILATPTRTNNMSAASKRNDVLKRKAPAQPTVPYLSVRKYTFHH